MKKLVMNITNNKIKIIILTDSINFYIYKHIILYIMYLNIEYELIKIFIIIFNLCFLNIFVYITNFKYNISFY